MKITANRRDEILKRKSEYEADKAQRQSKYDEQYSKWDNARHDLFDSIKSKIDAELTKFDKLEFETVVRDSRYGGEGLEFRLTCNENIKFSETSALSWSYNAYVTRSGEVAKETSSWSGLQATTSEQIDSLRQTLAALEYLNSIDWATMLNVKTPDYDEYIEGLDPTYETAPEDFDKLLQEADVEDIIGTTSGVLCNGGSKYYRGDVYRFIKSQTDKSYVVFDIPESAIERYVNSGEMTSEELYHKYEDDYYRVSKTKFFDAITEPMKILKF